MKEDKETIKLIFDESRDRLSAELKAIDDIATKYNFIFAFKAIVLASIFTSSVAFNLLARLGILVLTLSVFVDLYGFWMRNYRRDPDTKVLFEKYKNYNFVFVQKRLIYNFNDSIICNSKKREKQKRFLNLSIALLGISLLLLSFQLFGKEVSQWLAQMATTPK